MRADEASMITDKSDVRMGEKCLDARTELCEHFILAGHDLTEVKIEAHIVHAEKTCLLQRLHNLGITGKRFRGDATLVQTGAAHMSSLKDDDLQPCLRS